MAKTRRRGSFADRVITIVKRIPKGTVATYGQVAALAGSPRSARMVGWVLRHAHSSVPWQRVINREGRISIIHEVLTAQTQAALLKKENIAVAEYDGAFWVNLDEYIWKPRQTSKNIQ